MKLIAYLFFISLAGMLALSSCKKNNPATISNITITVKGKTYQCANVTQSHWGQVINMRGSFSDSSGAVMVIGTLKVGTFDVLQTATRIIVVDGNHPQMGYASGYGTVTITSSTSTTLTGTFNVMADNAVAGVVTGAPVEMDDSFNINLTK